MRLLPALILPALLLTACAAAQTDNTDTGVVSSAAASSAGMKIAGSSSGGSAPTDIVRKPVTATGRIGRLPKKGDGPHTMECAMGLIGEAGAPNYALDASKLENGVFEFENTDVTVNGLLTPIEMISAAQMHTYDIVGILSVDTIEAAE